MHTPNELKKEKNEKNQKKMQKRFAIYKKMV
jgi:hypothetical protein